MNGQIRLYEALSSNFHPSLQTLYYDRWILSLWLGLLTGPIQRRTGHKLLADRNLILGNCIITENVDEGWLTA